MNTTEALKKIRKECKLPQTEMAEFIGVSQSMYEKVERGAMQASRNFMLKLKDKFPYESMDAIFLGNNSINCAVTVLHCIVLERS